MDGGKCKIFIGKKSYFDFIEIIKPNVAWDCFAYKIDTSGYTKIPHKGEDHSNCNLTEIQIDEIFKLRKKGMFQKEIAKQFGVSGATISMILSGDRRGREGDIKRKPRITKEMKQRIIDMCDKPQKEIAKIVGVNPSAISRILKAYGNDRFFTMVK